MRAWQALVIVFLSLTMSVARAETVEVAGDYGGFLVAYEAKWKKLADEHARCALPAPAFRLHRIGRLHPTRNICATPKGSLGFHLAFPYFVTPSLWKDYPPDIQAWITRNGGLTYSLMWLQAPEDLSFLQALSRDLATR